MVARSLILWDFHGTLSYHPEGWRGAIAQVIREHEPMLGVTDEDIRPHLRCAFPWDTPEVPHTQLCHAEAWWKWMYPKIGRAMVGVGVSPSRAAELAPLVRRRYVCTDGHHLFDDVMPTLHALADLGWTQVILSNHVPELPDIVRDLGLGPYIEQIVNSAAVGYEKPHPAIYRHAFEALNVDPLRDCVWMVGDNFEADVLGALAMGVDAVLVRRQHPNARRYSEGLVGVVGILTGAASTWAQQRP